MAKTVTYETRLEHRDGGFFVILTAGDQVVEIPFGEWSELSAVRNMEGLVHDTWNRQIRDDYLRRRAVQK